MRPHFPLFFASLHLGGGSFHKDFGDSHRRLIRLLYTPINHMGYGIVQSGRAKIEDGEKNKNILTSRLPSCTVLTSSRSLGNGEIFGAP